MKYLTRQRLLEILPGLLSWGFLLLPLFFSFLYPAAVIVFVLFYAVYWLFKALFMSYHLIAGYKKYKQAVSRNWQKSLKTLLPRGRWRDIWHVVIIPMTNEELPILTSSFAALAGSDYPLDRIIVVLAIEGRFSEHGRSVSKALRSQFEDTFASFFVTEHPADLPGEIRGKGPNITWAGKQVSKLIRTQEIPSENVIVTTLDADNRVHKQYFAALTYAYLTNPDPIRKSYQPISMYFNNIWQVPLTIRLVSIGSSFWQMIESSRPHRLRNFSAHAQSLKTLLDTNFWSVKTIVEDGHQFWRTFFAYDGIHRVVPIHVPVYQDAVFSPFGPWATLQAQYQQRRRWAWGASDVAYVGEHLLQLYERMGKIPWHGLVQWFRLIEGHTSLATTSLILALLGWLPILVNEEVRLTVMGVKFPVIYSRLLTTASLGLLITMILTARLLPQRPAKRLNRLTIWGEWALIPLLIPLNNIFFGCLPALDAQTRLMLGRYMTTFHVTPKVSAAVSMAHSVRAEAPR
jgi:cellulose synthase/poly-beta-1,6-N-acetylglucosamine synthase-like glycosyltransferase